jgi:NAD(P)-dependent dehydrogenase (short-subunit alcohol dehydrogenase family)
MMVEPLVVIGAAGDLARAVLATCDSNGDRYLFDRRTGPPTVECCDVAVPSDVERVLDRLPVTAGQHWRMLSAVGWFCGHSEWDGDWRALRASIEVNLTGVAHFAGGLAHRLTAVGATGRLVIVGSAASRVGSRDVGYGTAKAGLVGLVRSLSKIYASRGVTAVGVEPGLFDSAMSRQQDPARRALAVGQNDAACPLELSDVAEVVRYMLCAAPDALSGSIIQVGGGR